MIGYPIAIERVCTSSIVRSSVSVPALSTFLVRRHTMSAYVDEDTTPLGSFGRRLDILLRLIGILAVIVPTLPECDGAIITP